LLDLTAVCTFGSEVQEAASLSATWTGPGVTGPVASSRRESVVAVNPQLHEPAGLMCHLQTGQRTSRLILVGELDLATADDLVAFVASLQGIHELVVDLALLDFIDVCGLRALVTVQQLVAERGGSLRLSRPRPLVRKMLALTGLDAVLPVDPQAA
jgi:anti-anti-sigma factor